MAIVVEQTHAFDNPTGSSTTWTKSSISTTAGRRLVLAVVDFSSQISSVTGVTDSAGNTWSQVVRGNQTSDSGASIWATDNNASAITSYTITLSVASVCLAQFYELSGTGAIDVTNSATGSSTTVSSGSSGTPAGTADVAIAVGSSFNAFTPYSMSAQAFTTGGGTFVEHNDGVSLQLAGSTGSVILSAATAQTFTYALGSSDTWAACVALWRPLVQTTATAGRAEATGTANNSPVLDQPNGGVGSGTGTANGATCSIIVVAGVASATGTAHNAAGPESSRTVSAGVASATGTAYGTTSTVTTKPAVAAGVGTAWRSSATSPTGRRIRLKARPAPRANVMRISATFATAGRAQGSGAAQAPSLSFSRTASPETATGVGVAQRPTAEGSALTVVTPGVATGSGIANDATVPNPLARARAALAASGSTACNVLFLGDSVTEMYSTGGIASIGYHFVDDVYAAQFLALQQARHAGNGAGYVNLTHSYSFLPAANWGSVRWTYSGGGSNSISGDSQVFGKCYRTPGTNEVITLTMDSSTGFKLVYMEGISGLGTFQVAIDGGAPTTVTPSTSGGQHSTGTWTSGALTSGSHTAVITPASGKIAYIRGAVVYDGDNAAGIRIWNHAIAGETTVLHVAAGGLGTVVGLTDQLSPNLCTNPALVVIFLGINDAATSVTTATYKTNMQTIIANIKSLCATTPSFVLVSPYDTPGATPTPYLTVLNEIATADPTNVCVLDLGSMDKTVGAGYFEAADETHPITAGHAYIGTQLDTLVGG